MKEAKFSPIFFLVICYVLGVALTDFVRLSFWIPIVALSLCIALLIVNLRYSFSFSFLLPYVSFFLVGFILASFVVCSLRESLLLKLARRKVHLVAYGEVRSEPRVEGKELGFTLRVKRLKYQSKFCKLSELTKVVAEGKKEAEKIKVGDEIKIEGVLSVPRNFSTSNQFDYKNYLYRQRIQTILTLSSGDLKVVQSENSFFLRGISFVRDTIRRNAFRHLGHDKGSLLTAIVIGEKDKIPEEVLNNFRDSGLAHVLVVSGLHVGLLATTLWGLLKWLG